jgi:hypothetical protein
MPHVGDVARGGFTPAARAARRRVTSSQAVTVPGPSPSAWHQAASASTFPARFARACWSSAGSQVTARQP